MKFVDPLLDPLPRAPKMNLYCLYGVNLPVERCVSFASGNGALFRVLACCRSALGLPHTDSAASAFLRRGARRS